LIPHLAELPFDLPGCGAWIVDDSDLVDECADLVSADDIRHAGRFRDVGRRTAAVAGSLGARLIAAAISGLPAAELAVTHDSCRQCGGPHGKPRAGPQVAGVSISHSDGLTGIALSIVNELGVDITLISPALYEIPWYGWTGHLVDRCPDLETLASRWAMVEAVSKVDGAGLAAGAAAANWLFPAVERAREFPGGVQTILHERDGRKFAIALACKGVEQS